MADRDNSKTGKNMTVELKARLIEEGKKATWGAPGADCKGGEKSADWNDVTKEGSEWPFKANDQSGSIEIIIPI